MSITLIIQVLTYLHGYQSYIPIMIRSCILILYRRAKYLVYMWVECLDVMAKPYAPPIRVLFIELLLNTHNIYP